MAVRSTKRKTSARPRGSHNHTLRITLAQALRASRGQIKVHPAIMGGEPVIAGTRIPVASILAWLRDEGSTEGVLRHYPDLTLRQVRAAISFAARSLAG